MFSPMTSTHDRPHRNGSGPDPSIRRALTTSSSLLVALLVLTAMSGPVGAPRTFCLAAATIGQTASTFQSTFRALTSRATEREARSAGPESARAAHTVMASGSAAAPAHRALAHVRMRGSLPPPAIG